MRAVDWPILSIYTNRKIKSELFEKVGQNTLNTYWSRCCLGSELHAVPLRLIVFFRSLYRPSKIKSCIRGKWLAICFWNIEIIICWHFQSIRHVKHLCILFSFSVTFEHLFFDYSHAELSARVKVWRARTRVSRFSRGIFEIDFRDWSCTLASQCIKQLLFETPALNGRQFNCWFMVHFYSIFDEIRECVFL